MCLLVQNILYKMIHKLNTTFHILDNKEQQSIFEMISEKSHAEKKKSADKEWYSIFDNPSEQVKCKQVSKQIEEGLRSARESLLKCEIIIPCGLTMRIARDIIIMSESEPCGVQGCLLVIHLQEKTKCVELIRCQSDHSTVSTFEIHLTLQEDYTGWSSLHKMLLKLTRCFKHSSFVASPKVLCLGYKLEKLKLYKSIC